VNLGVQGWKNSKAADSNDGGISKLREFLERKGASPNGPPAKITKVCRMLSHDFSFLANRRQGTR
jgi:hypothetical protein